MLRFKLTTALLLLTTAAVWFATMNFEESLGREVRDRLWFVLFAATFLAVVQYRGRTQAFWFGMALAFTMRSWPMAGWVFSKYALTGLSIPNKVANFFSLVKPVADSDRGVYFGVVDTTDLLCTLALGLICSVLSVAIYDRANEALD